MTAACRCMQAAYVDISSFSFSCCMLQNEFLCIDDNTPKRGAITKKVQEQKRLVEELVVQQVWSAYCDGDLQTRTWYAPVAAPATMQACTQTCSKDFE